MQASGFSRESCRLKACLLQTYLSFSLIRLCRSLVALLVAPPFTDMASSNLPGFAEPSSSDIITQPLPLSSRRVSKGRAPINLAAAFALPAELKFSICCGTRGLPDLAYHQPDCP